MRKAVRPPVRATVCTTNGPAAISSSGIRKTRWGARCAGQPLRKRRMSAPRAGSALGALRASLEPLDLAGGVDDVLGPGVERMAIRADLNPDRLRGRSDREGGAAAEALHLCLMVLGMNLGLHGLGLLGVGGNDAHALLRARLVGELDLAIGSGEQG